MAKKPYIVHVFPAGYKPDANRLKSMYPNAYFYPVKSKDKKEAWGWSMNRIRIAAQVENKDKREAWGWAFIETSDNPEQIIRKVAGALHHGKYICLYDGEELTDSGGIHADKTYLVRADKSKHEIITKASRIYPNHRYIYSKPIYPDREWILITTKNNPQQIANKLVFANNPANKPSKIHIYDGEPLEIKEAGDKNEMAEKTYIVRVNGSVEKIQTIYPNAHFFPNTYFFPDEFEIGRPDWGWAYIETKDNLDKFIRNVHRIFEKEKIVGVYDGEELSDSDIDHFNKTYLVHANFRDPSYYAGCAKDHFNKTYLMHVGKLKDMAISSACGLYLDCADIVYGNKIHRDRGWVLVTDNFSPAKIAEEFAEATAWFTEAIDRNPIEVDIYDGEKLFPRQGHNIDEPSDIFQYDILPLLREYSYDD